MTRKAELARIGPSPYTEDELELGLRALAIASGNAQRAADLLAAEGQPIPAGTLRVWKTREAARYAQIQEDTMPALRRRLAEDSEDIVQAAGELERRFITRIAATLDELEPRDLPGSLRNVTVAKAVNAEKAQLWRDRPTQIHATAEAGEVLKQLERSKVITVESSAVEIVEVPDEPAKEDTGPPPATP